MNKKKNKIIILSANYRQTPTHMLRGTHIDSYAPRNCTGQVKDTGTGCVMGTTKMGLSNEINP